MCIVHKNITIKKKVYGIINELYIVRKMSSGRVGQITFDIFKPMWSMCLLHLRSEDIISPGKLNSDTLSVLIVLIFKSGLRIHNSFLFGMKTSKFCFTDIQW